MLSKHDSIKHMLCRHYQITFCQAPAPGLVQVNLNIHIQISKERTWIDTIIKQATPPPPLNFSKVEFLHSGSPPPPPLLRLSFWNLDYEAAAPCSNWYKLNDASLHVINSTNTWILLSIRKYILHLNKTCHIHFIWLLDCS